MFIKQQCNLRTRSKRIVGHCDVQASNLWCKRRVCCSDIRARAGSWEQIDDVDGVSAVC